ncbi:hypothetical protein L1F30_11480 [Simiduia sp. 21SJ11W-1]|uniref:hypothetical protein n=1 Tax=Simiduia sp. 21SJ11W-1 TaxID=2909669 RepID=UPI00209E0726|nr:hypothetical protein [Simiduia sp. 21SJ11W-1]UTA46780.1 hypothetical protein L1F30_11480 [Simiduia sp. 21SJ11W-1]
MTAQLVTKPRSVNHISAVAQPANHYQLRITALEESNASLREKNDQLNEQVTLSRYFNAEKDANIERLENNLKQRQQAYTLLRDEKNKLQTTLGDMKLAVIRMRHNQQTEIRAREAQEAAIEKLQALIDELIAENHRLHRTRRALEAVQQVFADALFSACELVQKVKAEWNNREARAAQERRIARG